VSSRSRDAAGCGKGDRKDWRQLTITKPLAEWIRSYVVQPASAKKAKSRQECVTFLDVISVT